MDFTEFYEKNRIKSLKQLKNIKLDSNGIVKLQYSGKDFGGKHINNLLGKISYINTRFGKRCKGIFLKFDELKPRDKMTYILLECIIYDLFKRGKEVYISTPCINASIQTSGLLNSILCHYIKRKIDANQYMKRFGNYGYNTTYRRIIKPSDSSEVSTLMSEVKTFMKCFFYVDKPERDKIAEIVSELADNACEHAESECLIDIDMADQYSRRSDPTGKYYSVNICVINFSDICLGDKIKHKIINKEYKDASRYNEVNKAYDYHKKYFNDRYTENHFFMIAAFQNEISGRNHETETGGKGLTELIRELERQTEDHNCYVLSGTDVLLFLPECLEYNENDWVGFNESKDYLGKEPEKRVISDSHTYLCGTGYNITLIYRRNDNEKK